MILSDDRSDLFYVYDGGTIVAAAYESPQDRSEAFCIDEADVERRLGDLILECAPLAQHLTKTLDDGDGSDDLPEDAEELSAFYKRAIPGIRRRLEATALKWMRGSPDADDTDHFVVAGDGQAVAFNHFSDLDEEALELLQIVIVEGDRPGSTYFAAELRCNVDEANRICREHDLPYEFESAEW